MPKLSEIINNVEQEIKFKREFMSHARKTLRETSKKIQEIKKMRKYLSRGNFSTKIVDAELIKLREIVTRFIAQKHQQGKLIGPSYKALQQLRSIQPAVETMQSVDVAVAEW